MVLAGFPVQGLVNAEKVETYLKDKGMVVVDENEMQIELITPPTSSQAIEINDSLHTRMVGVAPKSASGNLLPLDTGNPCHNKIAHRKD